MEERPLPAVGGVIKEDQQQELGAALSGVEAVVLNIGTRRAPTEACSNEEEVVAELVQVQKVEEKVEEEEVAELVQVEEVEVKVEEEDAVAGLVQVDEVEVKAEEELAAELVHCQVEEVQVGEVKVEEEQVAELVQVEEVKQQYPSGSSSKGREVIYISDDSSSESTSLKRQAAAVDAAPLAAVKAEPLNGENAEVLQATAPGSVKVERSCELQVAAPPAAPATITSFDRRKEGSLVPKAEVIYSTRVVASGDAPSREAAQTKVAAEWGQLAQGEIGTGALSLAPIPLAAREPGDGGGGLALPPRPGSGSGKNPNIRTTHEGPRRPAVTVGSYTVQCCVCQKWRWIPNKQVYEHIREMNSKFPFKCEYAHHWAPHCSCEQPAEITAGDVGFVWAMDKANISRPPPGWERKVVIRGEGSLIFSDVYYLTPDGRTMRSMNDIVKFLADHPEEDASLAQFNFSRPRPMDPKLQKKRRQELLGAGSSASPSHKLLKS